MTNLNLEIVSLWELLEFDAKTFVNICQTLEKCASELGADKHRIVAIKLGEAAIEWRSKSDPNVDHLYKGRDKAQNQFDKMTKAVQRSILASLKLLVIYCEELELKFTRSEVEHLIKTAEKKKSAPINKADLDRLDRVLNEELSQSLFGKIEHQKIKHKDDFDERWKAIIDQDNKLTDDIESAARCLVYGENTACVFHLMRVMELSVKKIGKKLGVKNIDTANWQPMCDGIASAIKTKFPKAAHDKRQHKKRQEYNDALTLLLAVKHAWRNDVMHPKATYTDKQAEAVYLSVNAFMERLVSLT